MLSVLFFTIIGVFLLSGCVRIISSDNPTSDTYVFIDHQNTIYENPEGNYSGFPLISTYDPVGNGYKFNESTESLSYFSDFGSTNSSVAILGETESVNGLQNRVIHYLYPIYKTPYDGNNIKILNIFDNGTVNLSYNNKSILLCPGDEWINKTSTITYSTMPIYKIDTNNTTMTIVKINITTVDTIKNYGLLKKSKLIIGLGMIG